MPDDPTRLTAAEIARRVRAGELTALSVAEACLARAEKIGPALNTWIALDREGALRAAREVDAAVAAGRDPGPLAGVPVGLKDLVDVAGSPTTSGGVIDKDRIAAEDAPIVRRFREAGAVLAGKLNLHEFAFGPSGHNVHYGDMKNPWNTGHMTGGSSGGSGNAVASGQVPVAIGSDTGGSIRIPSALCGTIGHKPTFGLVSKAKSAPLSWSLDTFGPLARSAEDCALVMAAIAGHDPSDPSSASRPVPDFIGALEGPLKGVRVGHARSFYADRAEPCVNEAVEEAARALADAGAAVSEVDLPDHILADEASGNLMMPEAAAVHEKRVRERPGDIDPSVLIRLRLGFFIPATAYLQARRFRGQWAARMMREVFGKVDLVLSATVPVPAPPRDARKIRIRGKEADARLSLIIFTRLVNFFGGPSTSFPAGFSPEGLPVAAQLFGPPFADHKTLAAVHRLEKAGAVQVKRAPFEG